MQNRRINGGASSRLFQKQFPSTGSPYRHEGNGLVSQDSFASILCLERKRAERSGVLRSLVLVDLRELRPWNGLRPIVHQIGAVLRSSMRETDIVGWHEHDSIVGVLLTELGGGDRDAVRAAVCSRIRSTLSGFLNPEQVGRIHIRMNFFPETWDVEDPGQKMNGVFYPEQASNDHARDSSLGLKRAIDVAASLLGLVILSPVLALIALLVKLSSKGSALYRQRRVGQFGVTFDMLKFRSMYAVNDPSIHKEFVRRLVTNQLGTDEGREKDRVFKIKEDPRVTPLGRLLRKTSLDELPQLWNVLKGEMSLVGPRPPIPYEVECYHIWHRRRVLEAKPGITGLWQVNGRSRTTFDEMVRLDLKYARTWSLWLDICILLKTPMAILLGEGAH
jgi:lipopolysaccharide/colanic/teichoic acid biosynthesis glycosyltransferase